MIDHLNTILPIAVLLLSFLLKLFIDREVEIPLFVKSIYELPVEIKPISLLTNKLEKDNIGINHKVNDHKERIIKLEDRLREYEIKIASFNTAINVVKQLSSGNSLDNSNLLGNE